MVHRLRRGHTCEARGRTHRSIILVITSCWWGDRDIHIQFEEILACDRRAAITLLAGFHPLFFRKFWSIFKFWSVLWYIVEEIYLLSQFDVMLFRYFLDNLGFLPSLLARHCEFPRLIRSAPMSPSAPSRSLFWNCSEIGCPFNLVNLFRNNKISGCLHHSLSRSSWWNLLFEPLYILLMGFIGLKLDTRLCKMYLFEHHDVIFYLLCLFLSPMLII